MSDLVFVLVYKMTSYHPRTVKHLVLGNDMIPVIIMNVIFTSDQDD